MQGKRNPLLLLSLLALPSVAALAGDPSLRDQVDALRARAESLESQQNALLAGEIEAYLREAGPSASAQGGDNPWSRLEIRASATAVFLATVGAEVGSHSAAGDLDLSFDFHATPQLDLFCYLTANVNGAHYDASFGAESGGAAGTLSGAADGIGVDGTVSTTPGSVTVQEAGLRWAIPVGERRVNLMLGKLDPRNYFGQNAFADDENTQFLNNVFDDAPAIAWPSTAAGGVFGLQVWLAFGERDAYRADLGYYHAPGSFFDSGTWLMQISWRGDLLDREANIRLYGIVDDRPTELSAAIGFSGDWWVHDKVGVFLRFTFHDNQHPTTGEPNQIESDVSVGAMFRGIIGSRPDDTIGIAWAHIKGPVSEGLLIPGAPGDSEMVIEAYYRYMAEEGHLQISPMAQVIIDPGAGAFLDDTLFLIGLRIFATF